MFLKWLSLFRPQQEAQKIFKANHSMDTEVIKAKVGFDRSVSDGVERYPWFLWESSKSCLVF